MTDIINNQHGKDDGETSADLIWNLSSYNGRSSCSIWSNTVITTDSGERAVLARIVLHCQGPDKKTAIFGEFDYDNLVDDYNIAFKQVFIRWTWIQQIFNCILQWENNHKLFSIEDEFDFGILKVQISPSNKIISSNDKPVFMFGIDQGRVSISHEFIVDQSCLALMSRSLQEWLHIHG